MKRNFMRAVLLMLAAVMVLSIGSAALADGSDQRIVDITEPRVVVTTDGLSEEDTAAKLANLDVIEELFFTMYWDSQYADNFSEDFYIDLPFAPPGMPTHFDAYNSLLYMGWLSRTVSTWEIDPTNYEIYGTPDPNVFFMISYVTGDVNWGGNEGTFSSKRIDMIQFTDGQISYLKEWTNPLEWLYAAGREVPTFQVDTDDERVVAVHDEYFGSDDASDEASGEASDETEELDMSEEAIAARFAQNIAFMKGEEGAEEIDGDNYINRVLFMPPDMYEPETYEADEWMASWSIASELSGMDSEKAENANFDIGYGGSIVYETDDPLVYFNESSFAAVEDWIGNEAGPTYYRNWYIHVYRFNEDGTIRQGEEHMNPINKFNCLNISIPSFPYFY